MTKILFQRCDGKSAGEPITLPKQSGRRRLSTVMRRHVDRTRPHIASVHRRAHPLFVTDASVRLRKNWKATTLGPYDTLIVVYLPQGGRGGATGGAGGRGAKGVQIGLLVATVALAAIGQFWAIGAIGAALNVGTAVAGTIWAAASMGVIAGFGYLLSKGTKAKANKELDNRPVYGVSGGGNLPRSGDRVPVIYGRTWTTPDLSQPDYSIYSGDDQILYKRMTIGCGKHSLKTIRVNNIVMWTDDGGLTPPFANSTFELIQPGGTSTLVPGQVATVAAVGNNQLPYASDFPSYAGPFDFGADAPLQSRIQLDFSLPAGVYAIGKDKFAGKQYEQVWAVQFDYAPCDEEGTPTGPWSPLYTEAASVLSVRALRYTRFVDIPLGRYTYRARNTGPKDVAPGVLHEKLENTIVWDGLRAHIPETIVRPGICELAMQFTSGKALGVTSFGEVEVEVQRLLPVWDGTNWTDQETRKCVWAAADILRDGRYGADMLDSSIDVGRLLFYAGALSQYDTFDGVIRGPVSVYDALTTVLGPMRASPLRLGNAWTIVRDEAKVTRKHVISRRQILSNSTGQTFNLDLSDGSADIIVEYFVGGDPRRMRTQRVTFGTETSSPRRLQALGATTGEHAVHLATWAAATAYYRRERRSLKTELAGRLLLPNDRAMIDAWYFDGFDAYGVVARDGLTLTLDAEPPVEASRYAMLRGRDGKEWGPVAVTFAGSRVMLDATDVAQAQILSGKTLDQIISTSMQASTTIMIGTLQEVQDAWLIRTVRFSGENVNVEAVFDAPQVWSALGESPVLPPPPPSSGLETDATVAIPYVRAEAVQLNGAMFMSWTCGRARSAEVYVVQISYDSFDTYEEVNRSGQSSGSYPLRETTGIVYVRAYAISALGHRGQNVFTQFSVSPAQLDMGNAIHGSLAIEAFTDALEPVGLVDGLPDPFGYTRPRFVANIQEDGRLYKFEGGAFVPAIDLSEVSGQIAETQIADDSISTPMLKANSVVSGKIAALAISAAELQANSVVAGKIQAGAVSADKINVTKLDAISADLGSILGGSLNINGRFIVAPDGSVTIMSAASGQRLVITSATVLVYDAGDVLRVRLGIW